MGLGQEILLRRDDLRQRVGARDERPELVAFDVADQVLEDPILLKGAAEKCQVLQVEAAQIELREGPPIAPATA